jgi:hypothetical protein
MSPSGLRAVLKLKRINMDKLIFKGKIFQLVEVGDNPLSGKFSIEGNPNYDQIAYKTTPYHTDNYFRHEGYLINIKGKYYFPKFVGDQEDF